MLAREQRALHIGRALEALLARPCDPHHDCGGTGLRLVDFSLGRLMASGQRKRHRHEGKRGEQAEI
jgi:hypothetical protein